MEACRSIPLQRVTSLCRRAQAYAAAASCWLIVSCTTAGVIVQGCRPTAGGGACNAPLLCCCRRCRRYCCYDCETVGIPPLMSRKTLGILDGGRGGAVDRSWRRRGIRGVDKGGA